jgi:hypothetical protein
MIPSCSVAALSVSYLGRRRLGNERNERGLLATEQVERLDASRVTIVVASRQP